MPSRSASAAFSMRSMSSSAMIAPKRWHFIHCADFAERSELRHQDGKWPVIPLSSKYADIACTTSAPMQNWVCANCARI